MLKSLASMKTHLAIESSYHQGVYEDYGINWLITNGFPFINEIEQEVLTNKEMTEENFEILLDLTETTALINSLATEYGVKNNEVEDIWDTVKKSLIKQGISKDDDKFYPYLVSSVKKALKSRKKD